MYFSDVRFEQGNVDFLDVRFGPGKVAFYGAQFSGATVDFSEASVTEGSTVSLNGSIYTGGCVIWGPLRESSEDP